MVFFLVSEAHRTSGEPGAADLEKDQGRRGGLSSVVIKRTSWTMSRLCLMKPSGLTKRSVMVPRTAAHMPIVTEHTVA